MMPITITVITNLKNAVIEAPCLDDNNDSEVLTTSSSSIPKLKRRFSNSSCAEEKKSNSEMVDSVRSKWKLINVLKERLRNGGSL